MNMLEKKMTVNIREGVHGRIAAEMIRIANTHNVIFYIKYNDHLFDCSSVLDILSIALVNGATFRIRIEGRNREQALGAVEKLLTGGEEF